MIQASEAEDEEELIYQSSRIVFFLFDFEPDSSGISGSSPSPVSASKNLRLLSDKEDFLDSLINIYDGATNDGLSTGGGYQLLTLLGFTEFFSGFFAGSVGGKFDELEVCRNDVEIGWVLENYLFQENIQNGQSLNAVMNFWNMMWYLHQIMESCVLGAIYSYADLFWEQL
jgi:hypothetical protein